MVEVAQGKLSSGGAAGADLGRQSKQLMREVRNWRRPLQALGRALRRGGEFSPDFEIYEHNGSYICVADVPGVREEQLEIGVLAGRVEVQGRREPEADRPKGREKLHRAERAYGSFHRTIELPERVEADAVAAKLNDGVLRLEIRKAEGARPKRVPLGSSRGEDKGKPEKQQRAKGE